VLEAAATGFEIQSLKGTAYDSFVNALRSPETKRVYVNSLKRYMKYLKITDPDDLLKNSFFERDSPKNNFSKVIETHLIDYVMSLRQDGIAYATIQHLIAPVFTFYQLNDVIVNRKKVHRYLGERKRVVKDKAYTIEQIGQALQNADQRMRMIILILASTGCRIGALPGLTLGDLTKLPDVGLYKIIFYEGTNNEYYSFCTRECASTGIENYLNYRLAFNQSTHSWGPADTPLIRLSFDATDSFQASRQVKKIGYQGLKRSINLHLIRSGLRQVEHPTEHYKRVRKSITLTNGYRKHVISTFIEAGLNHEIRELLVDHATGLDQSYFRPSEKQVLEEYMKAEPLLTVDPSLRLAQEVQTLRVEKNSWEAMRRELDHIKELLKRG
jgi:site-specific recombinase XerD